MNAEKIQLLIIEDNDDDVLILKRQLRKDPDFHFDLQTASDLKAAIKLLEEIEFDIVISDLNLPDSRGLGIIKRIKQLAPKTPIFLHTSMDDNEHIEQALKAGASDYIVKGETDGRLLIRLLKFSLERARLVVLKDDFVSIVSHELRTPISILKGVQCNLRDGLVGDLNESQMKLINMAGRNIERLNNLIDDLLEVSRLESGKASLNLQKITLDQFLEDFLTEFKYAKTDACIEFHRDALLEATTIEVDPDLLTRLLANLLNNALRFCKSKVTVNLSSMHSKSFSESNASENFYHIEVVDDGEGIPEDKIGNLFEKFVQAGRVADRGGYSGTGLGLAIVKEIVDQHHGKIWAENSEEGGAAFHFLLPNPE